MYPSPAIPQNMRNVTPNIGTGAVSAGGDNANGTNYTFASRDSGVPPGPNQALVMIAGGDDADAAEGTAMSFNGNAADFLSHNDRATIMVGVIKPDVQIGDVAVTFTGAIDQCRCHMYLIDGVQDGAQWQAIEYQGETGGDGELGFTSIFANNRFDGAAVIVAGGLNSQTNAGLFFASSGVGNTDPDLRARAMDIGRNDDTDGDSNLGSGVQQLSDLPATTAAEFGLNATASPQRHRGIVGTLV